MWPYVRKAAPSAAGGRQINCPTSTSSLRPSDYHTLKRQSQGFCTLRHQTHLDFNVGNLSHLIARVCNHCQTRASLYHWDNDCHLVDVTSTAPHLHRPLPLRASFRNLKRKASFCIALCLFSTLLVGYWSFLISTEKLHNYVTV